MSRIYDEIKQYKNSFIVLCLATIYSTAFCYQIPIHIVNYLGTTIYNVNLNFIDGYLPFIEWFIIFYTYYYAHVFVYGIFIMVISKEIFLKYITALIFCCTIGFIIFIIFPTCFKYPHEMSYLLREIDKITDIERNALPSFHVIKTYLVCRYYISLSTQILSIIYMIIVSVLIILSTVFIKVHSVVDIISGILLSELSIYLINRYKLYNIVKKFFIKIHLEF